MPESLPVLSDRVLRGRYRIVRFIARGGMAEVWEGYDDILARPVAVKVLHAHLSGDDGFVERFRREAVAAARLAHPNIVATFDAGTDDDVAFIVMELVRGRTLRRAIEEDGPLPAPVALHMATAVAEALEHAHRAGLVHRDIKPANILLAEDDATSGPLVQVKVADFGIAKLQAETGSGLTQTGAVVGTAKYLSPEQVEGRRPDARSDVYALGVVLYEMLCGRPPFTADTELATALQHVRAQPPPPRQLRSGIPGQLETVVLRAMAKDPDQRFASAAQLRAALLSIPLDGGGEPVAAPPLDGRGGPPALVASPPVADAPAPPAASAAAPALSGRDGRGHPDHAAATPPQGVPVARAPRRIPPTPIRGPRGARVPLVLLAGVVVTALLLVAMLLRTVDTRPGGAPVPGQPRRAGTVTIASVRSFDPEGRDGEENEARVGLAHDGDPDTSWSTDRYNSRNFGGLKGGVGLVLRLGHPARLDRLEVRSPTTGWTASVYVATRPRASLAEWGDPVATRQGVRGGATFDLQARRAGAVLLWITDPGDGNRAQVSEVALSAR